MVRLSRIYTRTGDRGETSLGDGSRSPKHSLRICAIGEVDEANAAVGLARFYAGPAADPILAAVQNDLFDLGADLCMPERQDETRQALRIVPDQVERLEREIDSANERLEPLESFVLPGGSSAAAHLHLARAVVRRAERAVTALATAEPVNREATRYLNRLSDLLFVLARLANGGGRRDVLWVPGGERRQSAR